MLCSLAHWAYLVLMDKTFCDSVNILQLVDVGSHVTLFSKTLVATVSMVSSFVGNVNSALSGSGTVCEAG